MLNSIELIKRFQEENHFTLSKIAHELRNPLTLMNSTIQMIEYQNPQMKDVEYWKQLNDDLQDVFTLINELTAFEKQQSLQKEKVNLIELMEKLIEEFSFSDIGSTKIILHVVQSAHQISSSFECDRIKIKQVFTNLIKNALEAMTEGQGQTGRRPQLIIDFELSDQPFNDSENAPEHEILQFLCISFRDNGPGISPYMQSNLYTPFISGKDTGAGIGLSIARDIILSHNGYMNADTSENGASFHIWLPFARCGIHAANEK